MPPTVAHNETREQATIRWLTSILAALVSQSPDQVLRIKRNSLSMDHEGQDLIESRDRLGNILLRFESIKHIAVYPLNGGAKWEDPKEARTEPQQNAKPMPNVMPSSTQSELFSSIPQNQPGVSHPKDQEQIRKLEETLKKQQLVNRIVAGRLRQEQQKRQSLEGILESADLFSSPAR